MKKLTIYLGNEEFPTKCLKISRKFWSRNTSAIFSISKDIALVVDPTSFSTNSLILEGDNSKYSLKSMT